MGITQIQVKKQVFLVWICKMYVLKRTTLIYTHLILSKMSLRERLVFKLLLRELVLLILRVDFFFPPPNCFWTVFVQFCKCFEYFCLLTVSLISEAASSNKSAPILFATWTFYFLIKRILVHTRVCARARKLLPGYLACPRKIGNWVELWATF